MFAQFNCASVGKHFPSDLKYSVRKQINFVRSFVIIKVILMTFINGFEKIFFPQRNTKKCMLH